MELQQTLEIQFEETTENTETMAKSIEEKVEDWAKKQLSDNKQKYFSKTEEINPEIEKALRNYPSKKGKEGGNYPDIKLFVETPELRRIPIMVEVKGTKGDLVKLDTNNQVENTNSKGAKNFTNIAKYAVNGAVHYAHAILEKTETYNEVIAVGVNGFAQNSEIIHEVDVWYVAKKNFNIPKHLASYSDMSFLFKKNIPSLLAAIDVLELSDEELELKRTELENNIEEELKDLNQKMRDELSIDESQRVQLITGLIMAGLGVKNKVKPLGVTDLKGEQDEDNSDGQIIMNKVKAYLKAKSLPTQKIKMITDVLNMVFIHSTLNKPVNGESKLCTLYRYVNDSIMKYINGELHNLDFTGRLFNVMNDWVKVPDGDKNDVVLTPRYVTQLMARLCNVNKDSYVWDFATGSAGFLISAMHEMIADAKKTCTSQAEYEKTVQHIKMYQLLGIEKLPSVYMLAVLNMILMRDGSANLINEDSLTFDGKYEQGELEGTDFPANVFLLNPPYSAPGKGLNFVHYALNKMRGGWAAVLIQENAGSGIGKDFAQSILRNNTLRASIKMSSKLFIGKAGVQTAIYVFEVKRPHEAQDVVKFIDFSEDGYARQNRKKSSQSVNLKDTDHAKERYQEIVNLIKYGRGINGKNLNYYRDKYIEDTIAIEGSDFGADWTYGQHNKINTIPSAEDFAKVVKDYLAWRVSEVIKQEDSLGKL